MKQRIIEATNCVGPGTGINHGKFMVCKFDSEDWSRPRLVGSSTALLTSLGWSEHHIWVLDLQTGEGGLFLHGGLARADLSKHRIWVCPLFESFLEWLYQQDVTDVEKLPEMVELPKAESALYGHRRAGPQRQIHIREGEVTLCGVAVVIPARPEDDIWISREDARKALMKGVLSLSPVCEACKKGL